MSRDPYQVLGVSRTATADEIKKAYRKLVKKYHPDLHPGDKAAAEKFKAVGGAYEIVGDASKRARFDRGEIDASGTERPEQQYWRDHAGRGGARHYQSDGGFDDLRDFSDIFSSMFGNAGAGTRGQARGANLSYTLEVDFVTAANGGQQRVTLPGGRSLDINIPAGVTDGQNLRLRGQGEPGRGGGSAGDALVEIRVRPHPTFERKGDDVIAELPVSIDEAALGAKVEAPTLTGRVLVTIPRGASSGQILRLKGKGIRTSKATGDLLIRIRIAMPKIIDDELEAFLKDWRERHAYNPRSE